MTGPLRTQAFGNQGESHDPRGTVDLVLGQEALLGICCCHFSAQASSLVPELIAKLWKISQPLSTAGSKSLVRVEAFKPQNMQMVHICTFV